MLTVSYTHLDVYKRQENKEGDFQLYAQGDKAILVHQGKSKTFSGWSHYLTKERL